MVYANRPSFMRPRPPVKQSAYARTTTRRGVQKLPSNTLRMVESRIQATKEKKTMDTNIDTALTTVPSTTSTNAGIIPVNLIDQGTDLQNRIGKKAFIKSLKVRISGHAESQMSTGSNFNNTLRVAIVKDRQPEGVVPNFDQIFSSVDQAGAVTSTYLDYQNPVEFQRFQVLREDIFAINAMNENSTEVDTEFFIKWNLKFKKPIVSVYNSATGIGIGAVTNNALYVIYRAHRDAVSSSDIHIADASRARITFTD